MAKVVTYLILQKRVIFVKSGQTKNLKLYDKQLGYFIKEDVIKMKNHYFIYLITF